MKTELELRHLRVFVSVVDDEGSLTRAARPLGLSQSTVSETLSSLERTLGVTLFHKATKGLRLTAAGEVVLRHARLILAHTSELLTELAATSPTVSATLVISTVESVSAYVLPSRLPALLERWPGVRLEVHTGTCPEIRERVATARSDVGLVLEVGTAAGDPSILARGRLLVVGVPSHPLANRRATPMEARAFDFYMCDAAGNYNQALRHYFDACEVPLPRTQSLGTVEGVKRAVVAGGSGLGVLPEHAVERELKEGVLAEVQLSPTLPVLCLCAVLSSAAPQAPVVDDLLRSLRGSTTDGLLLKASVAQNGGNKASVAQNGGNKASVDQNGDNKASVAQNGGNKAFVAQNGGNNAPGSDEHLSAGRR